MSDQPCELFAAEECKACVPESPSTPLSLYSRAGLPTLKYRVGTFGTFREAMLDFIVRNPVESTDESFPGKLFRLNTRESSDYSIAILELWAYVCDILTLYQQTYANEAFLRTAQLPSSLSRIAALLGYSPAHAVAATVYLAYLANKNSTAALPAGLPAQSIPPPGKTPVTFELTKPLTIDAAKNTLALLGNQDSLSYAYHGLLSLDAGVRLSVGNKLVFYLPGGEASEQTVTSVRDIAYGQDIEWNGNLFNTSLTSVGQTVVARWKRKFRYFGANSPTNYLQITGVTAAGVPTYQWSTLDPSLTGGAVSLNLDGVYDGVGAGTELLVVDGSQSARLTVASASTQPCTFGLVTGSCTQVALSGTLGISVSDARNLSIYEITDDALQFLSKTNELPGYLAGRQTLYFAGAPTIATGDQIIVSAVNPYSTFSARLKAIDVTPDPQVPGVFAVQIDPPLPALLLTKGATVYGNIGKATQGESQNLKVLGSGDASQAWQEFVLKSQPVTYVLDPSADRGARSTLQVFVNSEQWAEVASFYGAGPDDKIFITMLDPDGSTRIRFGDGATGRRLPTGSNNVMAMWRKGAGSDGNVDAGAVTILTKPVTGLRSVINPMAATGGAEGESNDALRVNAPSSVLTLDRAVSLRDYESLSLTYPGVAKASAWWAEFGDERGVALTVAAAGSKALADLAGSLRNFLDDHRDPNVPLSIADYTKVPFTLRLKVFVNAARLQSSVQTAVAAAIAPDLGSGYLSFARLGFGQSIFSSAILAAVQDVSGVDWVEMIEFSVPSPWQDHAFGDNSDLLDAVYIGPGEIGWPTLDGDMTASSIGITYSGGVLEAGS